MSPNSINPPLTGTDRPSDEGFGRRRLNDVAGLAAILSTAFVVGLITGVNTPAFAVVLFAVLGALAYGEQRMRAAATPARVQHHGFRRHVSA